MNVNKATLDLIKQWEGFEDVAYQDTGGVWTIGYGTTAAAGVGIKPKAGMTITEPQAEKYLMAAVGKTAAALAPMITKPINPNEFGAFVSLAYNIGVGAFENSTALRRFNAGDKAGAVEALQWFIKDNGKTLKGLVSRRKDEADLFEAQPAPAPLPPVNEISATLSLWGRIVAAILTILKGR
jgi:lysozyme